MARPASPSRRRRTRRVTAAGALLLLSVVASVVAVLSAPGATAILLLAVATAAVLSGLLLHSELRHERAEHAADRLAQAESFTQTFVARSVEHAAYAARVTEQVRGLQRQVRELEGTLRLAEARGDEAEHRLRAERSQLFHAEVRIVELEVALERRQSDQIDELAAWSCDDVDTVVDLLNWEQRVDAGEQESRSA